MERLTDWVLGHRLLVAGFWLVVTVAGAATAPTTVDRLGYDFALPGQPAYEANERILEEFGSGTEDPLLLVARGDGAVAAVTETAERAEQEVRGTRVVTPDDTDVLAAGTSAVAVVYPPVTPGAEPYAAALPALEKLVERASADGPEVQLTGFAPALRRRRGVRGPRRPGRGAARRARGTRRARAGLRLAPGGRAAARRGRRHPRHLPRAPRPHRRHRRGVRRAVPGRADRARCRHRLLPCSSSPGGARSGPRVPTTTQRCAPRCRPPAAACCSAA
ncbi:hypothetical protein [Nocardioides sp. TF02-7]|uniref:hypothetical protein n=1 Tax=Nocardioides sp. TF02-7 TaxID=2917724 RepID=UPI001F055747|nr:hypothetical protein [Nocardioides sp. TF02-7]UMG94297.1 hypothetical protein MF408_09940 [Nocardioides sp. TF02-7]